MVPSRPPSPPPSPSPPPPAPAGYTLLNGRPTIGVFVASFANMTMAQCTTKCNDISACVYFYLPSTQQADDRGYCQMFSFGGTHGCAAQPIMLDNGDVTHMKMCSPPPPPSPITPPPLPPSPPPLFLGSSIADVAQAWVLESSITERNLCAPTAFATLVWYLNDVGALLEAPVGTPITVNGVYDTPGWFFFLFDGPNLASQTVALSWAVAASSYPTRLPSFDWMMNTNANGAIDLWTTSATAGTTVDSAIRGADAWFSRTSLVNRYGYSYHKGNGAVGGAGAPSGWTTSGGEALDGNATWDSLLLSVQADRPVVLFMDSYAVGAYTTSVHGVYLHLIAWFTTFNSDIEQIYEANEEAPSEALGHAVVAVGFFYYGGCKYVVVRDGVHTTPADVALPFDGHCTLTVRTVWQTLLASYWLDPPW